MDLKYFKLESSGNNFILLDFIAIGINQFDKISNFIFKEKAVKSSDENIVILKEEYDNWRGNIPPIDDVLVIGFQI